MIALIKDLYVKSKQLYDHVMSEYPADEAKQDDYIENITDLINERQQLVDCVREMAEITASEQQVLEEVLKLDKVIEQKLLEVQKKIGTDLSNLKVKKQKGKQYENPYNNSTVDGVFFDKRGI
ncbi:MAG TPA: hypothetical protein GX525_03495 [Bacilli bacterium]|nr:hypothetical protein [Bacilli bacterium]